MSRVVQAADKLQSMLSPEMVLTCLVLMLPVIIYRAYEWYIVSRVPLVSKSGSRAKTTYMIDSKSLLTQGYNQFKKGIFRLWTPNGYVFMTAPEYLDELKQLPDDTVDFGITSRQILMAQYTGVNSHPLGTLTVQRDLTRNLGKLVPSVLSEVKYALDKELPACEDWTSVNIYSKFLRMIAVVGGLVMCCPELNRTEEWIDISVNFTIDVFAAAKRLKEWPSALHPILQYVFPEVKRIQKQYADARNLTIPIMKARREASKKPGYVKPVDFMQWVMDNSKAEGDILSDESISSMLLTGGLASIHTTSMAGTHALYDLAAHPEFVHDLREEMKTVLKMEGGQLSKDGLTKLAKLDSFMKESQRINPPGMLAFQRAVTKSISLSDSTNIPAGSHIAVASSQMASDPSRFTNPEVFDPLRFYNMRQRSAADANKHQFSSIDNSQLPFGYGRHACPGRFFASQEIKAFLVGVLMTYDIRLVPGEGEKKGKETRPGNWSFEIQIMPDPTACIQFRKIQA